MQLVTSAPAATGPGEIGPWAARAERLGFDVVHISETIHDPFTVAALALQHTERVTVRTSMALAFPRSPMITAYAAWDLSKFSGGRFQLGIASQVRGNIVGRFSAQWSEPVARLADYIRSLRAIFTSFQTGAKLDYVGPHYRFERLQPYFNPGPLEHAAPQIWTGAVNAKMCAMAGELADGFVCHPTNSHPAVLRSRTLPALAEGASRADRTLADLAVVANPHVMAAATRDGVDALRDQRRSELAFLYSTPAYRRQLEDFGLADVGAALSAMAQRNEWEALPSVLTDEVMKRLVPQGTYEEIPDVLAQWYSGLCGGINLPVPADEADDDLFAGLLQACRQIPG
ncbi:TIGR03617 family F420-dependent LLM class oxidoreductase [Mycolicibacterium aichiense]|uniref:LLM class F420-dependent oxidoreductase n=1 Tax=Mycolicibacterium aichiense TaxID=1799 RepID=A0AAD1HJM6_9MYCO|nr:TIGR03617 family F420-dependent LLM class oxidoreductase [Mycolicibacterium aichiense]MCV7020766.1 TIGR03617 family F420-dependent LLM class oxidoreductase [Mycolicibacterium aichiense]BBX05333.1 LLM class F420-dependent oxidoreductase [Mycolicibacterium aichiense]STZ25315.1 oxidoreductase [Mycolicibacterium aichiense]